MEKNILSLTPDAMRVTALNLPIQDVVNLCRSNKRFNEVICDTLPFWEARLLKDFPGSWPPVTKTVEEYRKRYFWLLDIEKFAEYRYAKYPEIRLYQYFVPENRNWTNEQWALNIKALEIDESDIKELPYLPYIEKVTLRFNRQFTTLPYLPNLTYLECSGNKITTLPQYPELLSLSCANNQIKIIPTYPKLVYLICNNNPLIKIEPQPNLNILNASQTPLAPVDIETIKTTGKSIQYL